MPQTWTDAIQGAFRDAYLDWSLLLQSRRDALPPQRADAGARYEPVFVRLKPGGTPADIATRRATLRRLVVDPGSPLLMDPHELGLLEARVADPAFLDGMADEYALYRRLGTADDSHGYLFDVLDTGMPVSLDTRDLPDAPAPTALPGVTGDGTRPIVAAIDDGIGFLNARFRRIDENGVHHSRFHAVWLQALEQSARGAARCVCGTVLDRVDIAALLPADGRADEAAAYAALNAGLYGPGSRRSTEYASSHGTHVLDLAAGAEPDDAQDPARDWPLLGVQLPPEAVGDTSGTRFESYMVQAVRWILLQARGIDSTAPVIVNISLGILAGPKDGSRFCEYQIAREAAQWERVTGQPVRIVWSFGNNHHSDLVASYAFEAEANRAEPEREITWRAQPGDQTASYLELHTHGADSTAVQIALTAPDGTASGFAPLAPGEMRTLQSDGRAVARLYHVAARDYGTGTTCPAHYVFALAPTEARKATEAVADSGAWRVGLRHDGAAALTVTLQVQRDDSPGGFRTQARQAYLDHPGAYGWDDERLQYTALAPDCPITHAGSHSALTTAPARQVFSAAAARRHSGTDGFAFRPASYSAQGADWSVPGPTGATLAEDGRHHPGRLAAGTFSGSTSILSGTSAAAGLMSRALALSAAGLTAGASGAPCDDFSATGLSLHSVPPGHRARLGACVVDVPDRRMPRR